MISELYEKIGWIYLNDQVIMINYCYSFKERGGQHDDRIMWTWSTWASCVSWYLKSTDKRGPVRKNSQILFFDFSSKKAGMNSKGFDNRGWHYNQRCKRFWLKSKRIYKNVKKPANWPKNTVKLQKYDQKWH